MQPRIYFIGFFLLLCFFSGIEYFFSPPLLYEGDSSLYEAEVSSLEKEVVRNAITLNPIDFALTQKGFTPLSMTPSEEIHHLFHMIPLDPDKDDFRAAQVSYFQENSEKKKEKFLVEYEVFSTKPRTVFSAYTDLKGKVKKSFLYNPEARVIEENKYGDKSFIIRLEGNQKTMYLVVAYRDRLLGFEYLISRHEQMEKVFTEIFSD